MITLEPHQQNAVNIGVPRLKKYRILYLRFWMRKGKTLTSLSICNECLTNTPEAAVLFVTEKAAISSVQDDFSQMESSSFKLTIINYESLHKIALFKFNIIIVDEAHRNGAFPKPGKAVQQLKLIAQNKAVIFLSATETPESYSQYYHQFWISTYTPFAKWPTFYLWAKEFVNIKVENIKGVPVNNYKDADLNKIRPYIKHLFITVGKDEGRKSADINEKILEVEMSAKCVDIYRQLKRNKIYINENGEAAIANSGGELDNKLCQISSGTLKFNETLVRTIRPEGEVIDTSKAQFIRSYFFGKKIAILYCFIAEGEMLKKFFPNHTDDSKEFNNRTDLVYIKQVKSARLGVNLSSADCLVMFNIQHALLSLVQGMARIDSMYREIPNDVFWIFSKHGIEREIYTKLKSQKMTRVDTHYAA